MYQHQLVVSDGTRKTSLCGCGPRFFSRFGKSLVPLIVITVEKYSIINKDGHKILTLDDFSVHAQQPALKIGEPTDLDEEPQTAPLTHKWKLKVWDKTKVNRSLDKVGIVPKPIHFMEFRNVKLCRSRSISELIYFF